MTLILVEGPDCAGKSTLVDALHERLRLTFPDDRHVTFHKTPPRDHPLVEYVEPLLGYRPGQGVHVVADRWHWGEAVYPDVLSRPTRLDPGVWRYIEMFLRSRGAVVAYPLVESEELVRRLRVRGDDLVDESRLLRVDAGFRSVASRSLVPVFRYSNGHRPRDPEHLAELADRLVSTAMLRGETAERLNDLHTYVGPPRPDFLLVGDERPPRTSRDHPAFMPFAPRSGHYLLNALRGPRLDNLGLVNANDVDDVEQAWVTLGRPSNVLALGRLAHRRLDEAGIPHGRVPHPQFVRRFYQRHRDEYGTAIDTAMSSSTLDLSGWRPAHPSWGVA